MRRRLWAALVFGMMAAFAQPAGAQDWNTKVTLDAPAGTSVTVTLTTGNVTLNAGGFTYMPATHWAVGGAWIGNTTLPNGYPYTASDGTSGVVKVPALPTEWTWTLGASPVVTPVQTVTVRKHDGTPIKDASVKAIVNSAWTAAVSTDVNGQAELPTLKANCPVYVTYNGTTAVQTVGTEALTFFTTLVNTATNVAAPSMVSVKYISNSAWWPLGTAGDSIELLPSSSAVQFYGTYQGTQKVITKAVNGPSNVAGHTDLVSFDASLLTVNPLPSSGDPLSNVSVKFIAGSAWQNMGVTDCTGPRATQVFDGTYDVYATYHGTQAVRKVKVDGNTTADFYTTKVAFVAKDTTGALIAGVRVQYIAGSAWQTPGTSYTTDTVGAPLTDDLFPGTYSVYGTMAGTQKIISAAIPGDNEHSGVETTVEFTLTNMTLWYTTAGGSIKYIAGSAWQSVTSGTAKYLFEGTYPFYFSHTGGPTAVCNIAVPASTYKASVAVIKVLNASGAIIKPDSAQGYCGGWKDATVDAGSKLAVAVLATNTQLANTYCSATLNSGRQEIYTNIKTNSVVIFRSRATKIVLRNHDNTATPTADAGWYAGGWKYTVPGTTSTGLTTGVAIDLLPGNYYFEVTYGGMRQEKYLSIPQPNDEVVFTTVWTTVGLVASNGTTPVSAAAQYYANGWKDLAGTNQGTELLPGNYYFAVNHRGMRQEQYLGVADGAGTYTAPFHTVATTIELRDSAGSILDGGTAQFYAGSWQGATINAEEELLPGNYYFAVTYLGMRQEQYLAVPKDKTSYTAAFHTVATTIELRDSANAILDGGAAQFYAGCWQNGSINAAQELLPGNYYFAVTYLGMRQEQYLAVPKTGTSYTAPFKTAAVHSTLGTCKQFYAGGWKDFSQDMELLPGNYYFKYPAPKADIYKNISATSYTID